MLPMEIREKFINLLVETGNVSVAAKQLGINRMTAYGWRSDPAFAQKWDFALAAAREGLKDRVLETACAMGLAEHVPLKDDFGSPLLDENFEPIFVHDTSHVDVRVLIKLLDKTIMDEVHRIDQRSFFDGQIGHGGSVALELINPDGTPFLVKEQGGPPDVLAA
jgi:hypothetical protein